MLIFCWIQAKCRCSPTELAPLVLRILPLQFLLELRVMFAPEAGEVLRDLNRAHVGCKDVKKNRDSAHGDFGRGIDVVEFLDAKRYVRRIAKFVGNFWRFAVGEVEAFGSMFVDQFLLGRTQPGFHDTFHGLVLDIFVAECAVTDLFYQMTAIFATDWRQSQFWTPSA